MAKGTTTVTGGSSDLDQDFGYQPARAGGFLGYLGDTVFIDHNQNGIFDISEGVGGVVVELYSADNSRLLAQMRTNSNGYYSFGGLSTQGAYNIRVAESTLPGSDLVNSVDPDGGNDSRSFINLLADPDGNNDGINVDQDFGYISASPGKIGDLVWLDANADGFNDGAAGPDGVPGTDDDEPGIEGITLNLYLDINGDGLRQENEPKVASSVTDANGVYEFDGLPSDNYIVDVTDTAGFLKGYWHTLGLIDTNNP